MKQNAINSAGADFVAELADTFVEEAPLPLAGHSAAAARAALDMLGMVVQYNTDGEAAGQQPIAIGIGTATGERVATPALRRAPPAPASATP